MAGWIGGLFVGLLEVRQNTTNSNQIPKNICRGLKQENPLRAGDFIKNRRLSYLLAGLAVVTVSVLITEVSAFIDEVSTVAGILEVSTVVVVVVADESVEALLSAALLQATIKVATARTDNNFFIVNFLRNF